MGVDYGNILKTFESALESSQYPTRFIPDLTGGIFYIDPLNECKTCPCGGVEHKSWGQGRISPSTPWANPIKAEQRIDVRELRKYQLMIKLLNFMANGLVGKDFIYNTAASSNFVTRWEFPIIAAYGNQLMLDASASRPDNIGLYQYKYWDEQEWCWKWATVYGTIQPLDMVMFAGDSILKGRIEALITNLDFSELDSQQRFVVTLNQTCQYARASADPCKEEPQFIAQIYRHAAIPEQWEEIYNADLLACSTKEIIEQQSSWPPDKIFELKNTADYSCRIAIPNAGNGSGFGQTFMVKKLVSGEWVDITATVIDENRVTISQPKPPPYQTKVYLGTQLPGGGNGSDLLAGATAVRIWYMPEARAGDTVIVRPCTGRCKWSYEEYNGVLGYEYGDRMFHCHKKYENPTGLANYMPMCFQYNTCNKFGPLQPYVLKASTLDRLRCAFDAYYEQVIPGVSYYRNFFLGRVLHPSIAYLLGLAHMNSDQQMFRIRVWLGNHSFGLWNGAGLDHGAFWLDSATSDPDKADIENPATWPQEGILAKIPGFQQQKDGYKSEQLNDTTDPYREKRYTFARSQIGYMRDEGTLGGRGEKNVQRFFANKETIYLPNVETGMDKDCGDAIIEFGSFVKAGNTYQKRIKIKPRGLAGTEVKVSGTIYSAVQDGAEGGKNLIKIQCELGSHQGAVGPVMGEDRMVQWQGGGNIVPPPVWANVRSFYEVDKVVSCPTKRAWPGDCIIISGTGVAEIDNIPFFVVKGKCHAGDRLGFGNKVKRVRFRLGGYFSVADYHGWQDDEEHTVDDTKVENITDSLWMTKRTGPDRPIPGGPGGGLANNEYWFDEETSEFCFSPYNCKTPSQNGDTIKIYWKKDGEPGWYSVQKSDTTVPTGFLEHSFEDSDFDIDCPDLEVRGGRRVWDNALRCFVYEWTEYTRVTNGDPGLYEFYYYKTGTYPNEVHHFRFSYHDSQDIIEIKYTKEEAANLDGVVGLPTNYKESWGDKADCLWILDENGKLTQNIGSLEGCSFNINSQGVLHPTKAAPAVRVFATDYQDDNWQEVQASSMWIDYALGYIYFDPVI